MPLTYESYLSLPDLLKLQTPASDPPEHDEMLFIITHQTYELWFKQLLHELDKAKGDLSANNLYEAIHTFQRCRTIMKTLVGQLDIIETMTPMSFTSFRERLETASGFQSYQFREFEFLLGYKRPDVIEYLPKDSSGYTVLRARLRDPSLVDHFYAFLGQNGVEIPAEVRDRDVTEPNAPVPAIQEGLHELYRNNPPVGILLELMTDFDEGLLEWRYRHIMLVARTIGEKQGTGGSLGVEFLKKSLFNPVFADLWAIRHRL